MSDSDLQGFAGYLDSSDRISDFTTQAFIVNQIIGRLATTAVVKVVAVTNNGGVAAIGRVDVVPLVNQVDGAGNPTPHATIHDLPYFRVQGGTNAVILDPLVGDIGFAVFCSRDISTVKRTKAPANPESNRRFNWADGIYVGSILGVNPTQYVQFNTTGITVSSPTKITLTAPQIAINGTTTVAGATTINGNVATTGTLTNNAHNVGSTHVHTSSGGTGLGGPPV
jgi:hypothetical protein